MILILIFELNYFVYIVDDIFYYIYWHFEWHDIASGFNIQNKSCLNLRIFWNKSILNLIELYWIAKPLLLICIAAHTEGPAWFVIL